MLGELATFCTPRQIPTGTVTSAGRTPALDPMAQHVAAVMSSR
jgi:hypothetical protein